MGKQLPNDSYEYKSGCGNLYVHFIYNEDRSKLLEVQANLGKSGTCARAQLTSYCELLTTVLTVMPRQDAINALTRASGHKCQAGDDTCIEILNQLSIAKFLKSGG